MLLEVISLVLLVRFNNYQGATFFTSAGSVAGNVYNIFLDAGRYFHLKTENDGLLSQNLALTREVSELKEQLAEYRNNQLLQTDSLVNSIKSEYTYQTANVISNSLNKVNNYITLNKGSNDGVNRTIAKANASTE